ncbi:MAG TPA: xanthine dehydrogenase family protein molybdopterin-binding subunit, partial [Vineibacter sp.]|nr:xanthine dehydrogenase family protein molybdopterin-binding subunit [Vineibacter sp.]
GARGQALRNPMRYALIRDRARHVGDTVAMVVAETEAQAADAALQVDVDWEPLPAVVDAEAALATSAPAVWDEVPGNPALDWASGDRTACDAAFARAAHVVRLRLPINRLVVAAMEPRGAVGEYDAASDSYTLWTPTQGGAPVQVSLATYGLKVPASSVRVVTPHVGGGFGIKSFLYPEQVLVTWAAKRLGRPVKWYGDRTDGFASDGQARDHVIDAELALDADGGFLALRTRTVSNMGAYLTPSGPFIPTDGGSRMLANTYRIPLTHAEARLVFTHTTPIGAFRGAGKPEFAYAVERLVDEAARRLGIDAAELRRRNMIAESAMPWRTPTGLVYDSGDFGKNMRDALALADHTGLAARKRAARDRGCLLGFGFASYVEPDGFRDNRVGLSFDPTGRLTLTMSSQDNGQGHFTTFAQVVAERLGLPFDAIRVVQGDTARVGHGSGSGGSRTATVSGTAICEASDTILVKATRIAAQMLEAAAEDIVFADGRLTVVGTDRSLSLQAVARASFSGANVPVGDTLGLDATSHVVARAYSYSSGCHVAEVEIDIETGAVQLVRYAMVNDYGVVINPLLLDGQVHGGVVQGIGQILWEDCRYDAESGQLLTGSFMDYCLPRADQLPAFVWARNETRCKTNPLGVKGVGESGTTAAMPTVMNAVVDALAGYDASGLTMPVTSEKVWRVLQGNRPSSR